MATFAFKALDLAGAPTQGRDRGRRQAGRRRRSCARAGLIVLDIEEQTPANAGDLLARFKKVKADDLTIATRQLSTMVSSGMSLLRALYVIEEQTENDKLQRGLDRGAQGRRGRHRALRRAAAPPRRSSTSSTWRWCRPARPAASWSRRSMRVADQLEKDDALRRQVKAAMVYPSLIGGFALHRADRAGHVPRAGLREDLQGLRRRAAGDHQVHGVAVAHVHRALVRDVRRRSFGVRLRCSAAGRAASAAASSGTASS